MRLEWSIEGDKQLSRKLIGLSTDLQDFTEPFQSSADYLKETFSGPVFETKGAVIGERWKSLSPATVARKARTYLQTRPLISTGNMRASFKAIVSKDQAVIYNEAEYFAYHQSKKEPRTKIPRRVMMKLGQAQKVEVVRFFQSYLHRALKR